MTTIHHHTRSDAGARGALNVLGTFLVALPVIGVVLTALVALTGRWGGLESAVVTIWFIPMAIAWLAAPGAVLLLIAHRHEQLLKPLGLWAALMAAGWVFSLGFAALSGLGDAPSFDGLGWPVAATALGALAFLGGSLAMALLGFNANSRDDDYS